MPEPAPAAPVGGPDWSQRLAPPLVAVLAVVLVVAPAMVWFGGGTCLPWHPATADLSDLVLVERSMAGGKPVFGPGAPADLGFTPFGALVLAPLALLSLGAWQVIVTLASAIALVWLVRRGARLHGWLLVPASTAAALLPPVMDVFVQGQVVLILLGVVVADALGRPRRVSVLPSGAWVGLAAAIWLPLWWVLPALWVAGHRRRSRAGLVTWLSAAAVGWLVLSDQAERLVDAWSPGVAGILTGILSAVVAAACGCLWRKRPLLALGLVVCSSAGLTSSPLAWPWAGVIVVLLGLVAGRDDGGDLMPPPVRHRRAIWLTTQRSS